MSNWENAPDEIENWQGFVYVIWNYNTNKYYIGKKFFWSNKLRKPLKGRKNKRHYRVESDWKDYWGSSPKLLADLDKFGTKNVRRIILKLCKTKYDCAYQEVKHQLEHDSLLDPNCYNEVINLRIRKPKQVIVMTRAESKREAILRDYLGEDPHKKKKRRSEQDE